MYLGGVWTALELYGTMISLITVWSMFLPALRGRVNKNQPNLFLGEIDLFFFNVIAL